MGNYEDDESVGDAFRGVSIKDYDRNAELIIHFKERSQHFLKSAYDSVENYDRYINSVNDYYNSLVECRVIGDHLIDRLNIENYEGYENTVGLHTLILMEERGQKVRKIRRTGIMKKAGKECTFCKSTNDLHSHHIVPLYLGGTDAQDNFITVCKNCHMLLHSQIKAVATHITGKA